MVAQDSTVTPSQGRVRLQSTGEDSGDAEHGPIIDAYQALSNGSFESVVSPWTETGTVNIVTALGPITPRAGDRMLSVSSGPGGLVTRSTASIQMDVPGGALDDGRVTISLWYNYVSEEYPEFVGSIFNDEFSIDVVLPDGSRVNLVDESVNTTAWTPVTGIDFPGGDSTTGQSGWRFAATTIDGAQMDGENQLTIEVADRGDAIYDSVGLIDRITVG